jgi:hypothetical protein
VSHRPIVEVSIGIGVFGPRRIFGPKGEERTGG